MTEPPYEILSTDTLGFSELMTLRGVAKVCDRVFNSGRFSRGLKYVLGSEAEESPLGVTPYDFLLALSAKVNGDPSAYSQAAMYEQVCLTAYDFCKNEKQKEAVKGALLADFTANERTRIPRLLR